MNERKRIDFYKKKGQKIHVKLTNGTFYNGVIGHIGIDFFEIEDQKIGPVVIWFCEIQRIEPYREDTK